MMTVGVRFMSLLYDRQSAYQKLENFLPFAGSHYAKKRNYDYGAGHHEHVSQLSPALRRRLILEEEVIAKAFRAHGLKTAEKFIQEVFWRTYWKGWLEMRPSIWTDYVNAVENLPSPSPMMEKALAGETGLACFDEWHRELTQTNYLHNHARMWFASIWIFTFGLPWQAGAHFFMSHLADGDPASNTLGWRWVAGLQTKGKAYAARADNIDQFTNGRFAPYGALTEDVIALEGADNPPAMGLATLRSAGTLSQPYLLITAEDCHPLSLAMAHKAVGVMGLPARLGGDFRAKAVLEADRLAIGEAVQEAASHFHIKADDCHEDEPWMEQVQKAALAAGADYIALAYQPVGYWQRQLEGFAQQSELPVIYYRRAYDELCWPHAKKGFFPFKEKIPSFISQLKC